MKTHTSFFLLVLIVFFQEVFAASTSPIIKGQYRLKKDFITATSTQYSLAGWICEVGNSTPLEFKLYVGEPKSAANTIRINNANAFTASLASEAAVSSECGLSSPSFNRFSVILTETQVKDYAGKDVYFYLKSSDGNFNTLFSYAFKFPPKTQFGIQYSVYFGKDCPLRTGKTPFNITENHSLGARGTWGAIRQEHWVAKPADANGTYYCFTDDTLANPNARRISGEILQNHAKLLRDAQFDFAVISLTNWPNDYDNNAADVVTALRLLLIEWSKVPGAPKVVPWLPLSYKGVCNANNTSTSCLPGSPRRKDDGSAIKTMYDAVVEQIRPYPHLYFKYKGKPLLLANVGDKFTDDDLISFSNAKHVEDSFTIRKMWGHIDKLETSKGHTEGFSTVIYNEMWSFMEKCSGTYPTSNLTTPCNQRVSKYPGTSTVTEQVSITSAYQNLSASNPGNTTSNPADPPGGSVSKLKGRTLTQQFETLFNNSNAPIALITGWNEWVHTRACHFNSSTGADAKNGTAVTSTNGAIKVILCNATAERIDQAKNLANNKASGTITDAALLAGINDLNKDDDHFSDGSKVFIDSYTVEKSRPLSPHIDPTTGRANDCYYRLVKQLIDDYKNWKPVSNLQAYYNFCQ